jgi:hypothetical protein
MRGLLGVALLLAVSACTHIHDKSFPESEPGQALVRRASFDLNCPESELFIRELGPKMAGVRGCSRRAVYVHDRGQWIMNSAPLADTETQPSEAR